MKNVFGSACLTLVFILTIFAGGGEAAASDERQGWGTSDATPEPLRDAENSGYWWWPDTPKSNVLDSEPWGNRGIVYSEYEPPKPPPPPQRVVAAAPPPPPAPAPIPQRSVPIFNDVLFEFDGSDLGTAGKAALAKIVQVLDEYSHDSITVEGHTCNVNRSGDPEYNVKLGQRRADSVMATMLDQGVAAGRITAVSYGDTRPAASNDSADTRETNRRVVFVYSISD